MPHRPRKRFGQNFLHDQAVIARIIAAISPAQEDHIVEIGPGRGALTYPLREQGCHLDLIELDRDLAASLAKSGTGAGLVTDTRFRVHQGDALRFDYGSLVRETKLRIVGNLPYNISTPLLFHLLHYAHNFQDLHLMLQKEVAMRMAATHGKEYGRLSIMLQLHYHVEILFKVPPTAFFPIPKVDSAFLRLTPRTDRQARVECEATFARIVSRAFAQRRKTLRNSLSGLMTPAEIQRAGIDPQQRPQTITIDDFVSLANAASKV